MKSKITVVKTSCNIELHLNGQKFGYLRVGMNGPYTRKGDNGIFELVERTIIRTFSQNSFVNNILIVKERGSPLFQVWDESVLEYSVSFRGLFDVRENISGKCVGDITLVENIDPRVVKKLSKLFRVMFPGRGCVGVREVPN